MSAHIHTAAAAAAVQGLAGDDVEVSLEHIRALSLASTHGMLRVEQHTTTQQQSTPFPFPTEDIEDAVASAEFASKSLCERLDDVAREVGALETLILPTLARNCDTLEHLFAVIDAWHAAVVPSALRSLDTLEAAVKRAEDNVKVSRRAHAALSRRRAASGGGGRGNSLFGSALGSTGDVFVSPPGVSASASPPGASMQIQSLVTSFNSYVCVCLCVYIYVSGRECGFTPHAHGIV